MSPEALEALVAEAWRGQSDPAHDLGHIRRVWANCQAIDAGEDERADHGVLCAAAYLHDIVNLPKDDPDRARASRRSAARARQLLAGTALDLDAVAHAIAAHSFSAGIAPASQEARVLRDADRLDSLGAIGVARCFAVSGALGRALFDPDDPAADRRALNDAAWALDHFETKLFGLAATMATATGARLAAARLATMRAFRDQLLAEIA